MILRVFGVVTDGDVRRWILNQSKIDLSLLSTVAPSKFVSAKQGKRVSELNGVLTSGKKQIPMLNEDGVLVGVLSEKTDAIAIGGKSVGAEYPVYAVAEIGNNHQGSLETARKLL